MIKVRIHKSTSVDKEIEFSDILDRFHKDETILLPRTGWTPHKRYVTEIRKNMRYIKVGSDIDLSSIGFDDIYENIRWDLFCDYTKIDEPDSKVYFPQYNPSGKMYQREEVMEEFFFEFGKEHGYVIW